MKILLIVFALLLLVIPVNAAINVSNATNYVGLNSSILPQSKATEVDLDKPIEYEEGNTFSEWDSGSDMVATGVYDKGPTLAADSIYDYFGWTRGFIFSWITYNVDPEKIPIARDFNDMNTNLAVIIAVLFVIGESLSGSLAEANYTAYNNVFGQKDFSQKRYVGGGISVIAGLAASWIFRAIMIGINLLDAYLMITVMESIKPSMDNGVMYLCLAIIELLLFIFFLYRQFLIVAMYMAAPIFGVMWASGYLKSFIDSIGDKFVRALIMQPLTIFVTVVFIITIKALDFEAFGIKIFDADNASAFYLILLVLLLFTIRWCLFSEMRLVKRAIGFAMHAKTGGII